MEMLVRCEGCTEVVSCSDSDMSEINVIMKDGKPATITQWKCPKCGHIHSVQLDSERTKELFKLLKRKVAEVERVQRDLNIARSALTARYDGSIYQYGEQKFKLELCTPDAIISGEEETTNA